VSVEELRLVGEELRSLFAQERKAIATLDHRTLEVIAQLKTAVLARLQHLAETVEPDPDTALLFGAVRVEAQATAILGASAAQAARVLLGYEPSSGVYDRRARPLNGTPLRVLASR